MAEPPKDCIINAVQGDVKGRGHCAEDCDADADWTPHSRQFEWFFSPRRRDVLKGLLGQPHTPCSRCKALDLIDLLRTKPPWTSPQELIEHQKAGHSLIQRLGKAGKLELIESCQICVCLFAITPSPASAGDEVLLFPDWTWNRLAGENGTELDREEKQKYARCLLVALEPNASILSFYIRGHRGDALCIAEEDLLADETLGGRHVELHEFNMELCRRWLSSCAQLHGPDCAPEFTEELAQIKLIDLNTRQIVRYPGSPCDYAALSYVWGGVEQKAYRLGDTVDKLPRTIEDAITCAKVLEKQYLWVDAVCINQQDNGDKTAQIALMWSIYRGASITIFALSSRSAESGLPRFSSSESQPQLECVIDGVRLVGLMPTLSQYIWMGAWGSRAWTLQEALLSHRCLYLSDHQLYFECETIQYCESLNEQHSWAHNLTAGASPDRQHWLTWVMEQNGSGCLRNLLDTPADRLLHWGQKVTLYSYRTMTDREDGLRAFDGVLQRLQTMYPKGFFWGLPIEDFQWGLLWQSQWPGKRRPGFPSWSWASSEAGIMTPWPTDIKSPHAQVVPLRVWKSSERKLTLLFDANTAGVTVPSSHSQRDELSNTASTPGAAISDDFRSSEFGDSHDQSEDGGEAVGAVASSSNIDEIFQTSRYVDADEYALFLEAVTIKLNPDWSRPSHEQPMSGLRGYYTMHIAGHRCLSRIMTTDPFLEWDSQGGNAQPRYLVIAQNVRRGYLELLVLVVLDVGGLCVRATSMSLIVFENGIHDVLDELKLRREYLVLA